MSRQFHHALTAVALISALFAVALDAQTPTVTLSGQPTCAACRVTLTRIATVGATDGPGALADETVHIVRDARGRYLVSSYGMEGIAVYDSTARYLRQVGRKGQGPGEYGSPGGFVSLPGGQLAVMDGTYPRITILDSSFAVARTIPIPTRGFAARAIDDGRAIVFNAPDARRGDAMFVIDVASGKQRASFGAAQPTPTVRIPEGTLRSVATDRAGRTIWTSFATQYVLDEWSSDGRRLRTVERSVPWFVRPPPPSPDDTTARPPGAVIDDISVDDAGRLWVLARVADERWRSAIGRRPGIRTHVVTDRLRYQDVIVEVIDPQTRQVIASTRFDQPLSKFVGPGLVASGRLDDQDRPVVDIMRISLAGEPR